MDLHQNLGFLLNDVLRLYKRRFEERARQLSLTLYQCKALLFLARNEGVSQKRLSELIEVDPMGLVRILDRMEADGWVERRSDPDDRRARSLYVTEKAKPILQHIDEIAVATRTEALSSLAPEERTTFVLLLERLHENLLGLKPIAQDAATTGEGRKTARSLV